jgi:hypothetical protein
MEIFEGKKETFLFLNGISINRKIKLRENVELLPVNCDFSQTKIMDLLPNMGDFGVALIFLWLVKSQLHVTGDDSHSLVVNSWNSLWDGLLLGAIFNCEVVCNFQSSESAEEISQSCHFQVTNHHLRGLSKTVYEITEEDINWIEKNYQIAWNLLDQSAYSNAVHCLATYRWHSLPNARLALLWSGIEGLFNIDSEIVFKLSLFTSKFLYPDSLNERKATFFKVKKLYNQRSRAVHGSNIKGEPFTVVEESADLLRKLILRCILVNSIPNIEELIM